LDTKYSFKNAGSIDSPAVVVYPDLIKTNIDKAIKIAGGNHLLRPHVKTHKMSEISKMMLAAGITKFKCATIAEAEMLAEAGAKDILLAYQPTLVKAHRLAALARAYPDVIFGHLIDNEYSASLLAGVLGKGQSDTWIDINVGMNRTGVMPEAAASLYHFCKSVTGAYPAGLHAYDGHIHDTELASRFMQSSVIYDKIIVVKNEITDNKITGDVNNTLQIVMGGTPCFPYYATKNGIQTSPGTFVFWDEGYSIMFPDMDFEIAALLLTRIISIISPTSICLDLGHKSVAAESPLPRVSFPDHPEARVTGQSEEHLVVSVPDSSIFKPGDIWYGVPHHICPTIALYESVHTVEDSQNTGTWLVIARNRKIRY
jgi:D-serine deaminase-like pyridoxal phosphate-dependent protein